MPKKLAMFTEPTARRLLEISNMIPAGGAKGLSQYRGSQSSRVLVKLTTEVAGSTNLRVWEAKEVYLDTDGEATDVTGGLVLDDEDPIFTVADAAVDDVLMCERESRDTGLYWIGGAAGGGAAGGGVGLPTFFGVNKTLVSSSPNGGAWEVIGATNVGTFADEAALILALPTGSLGEYALVTATATFWTWENTAWVDSGSSDEDDIPGISGSWLTTHATGLGLTVSCEAGAWLFLVKLGADYYANLNFSNWRGADAT